MATATKEAKPAAKTAALKKPAGNASTAVALKKPSNANIVSIQDALKKQAEGMASRIAPATGNMIRVTQDKKFLLPDGQKSDGPIELVILDFIACNEFYEDGFDSNDIKPPGCFAIGQNPKDMAPSDNAPNKQSDSCQGCPMNEFGSNGNGKACKNQRLLACLPPDADEDTPIWKLKVSPTAIKGFDGFVASVARTFQMPPIAVITTIGFDDSVTYAKLTFSDPQPNKELAGMYGRQAEAMEMLTAERDVSGYTAATAKKTTKKPTTARR